MDEKQQILAMLQYELHIAEMALSIHKLGSLAETISYLEVKVENIKKLIAWTENADVVQNDKVVVQKESILTIQTIQKP